MAASLLKPGRLESGMGAEGLLEFELVKE